jgi:large subunit ribosomal protein L4
MPTVAIKTKGGGSAGEVTLSERIFGAPRNLPLMHQAVRTELENSRQGTQSTLTRGDILGGGRKPYRQKGTGRARQGSIVAPHYRHGGTALGPHPRPNLGHDLPRKMRRAAIFSALSSKLADGELIVVDDLGLNGTVSTKAAASMLQELMDALPAKKSLLIIDSADEVTIRSVRNIANVNLKVAPNFSTRDVVDGGLVVILRSAVDKIEATWNKSTETMPTSDETTGEEAPNA